MIHVCCAIIEHDDLVLICQRSSAMKFPLKWEFPGGKIEPKESKESCLIREIREELGVEITVEEALAEVVHVYDDFTVCLYPFRTQLVGDVLPEALEHSEIKWVSKSELTTYDWVLADIPIVENYLSL